MNKKKILEYFQTFNVNIQEPEIDIIVSTLKDDEEYELDEENGRLKISSIINPGKNGKYVEINYDNDEETKERSLVITKKEYNPAYHMEHGFRIERGIAIFTNSTSYVFDEDNILLYQSWFSDDNPSYGYHEERIDYSKEAMEQHFKKTTPTYEKGRIVSSADSAHQPFTNVWDRYGKTSVIREYGRSPMHGEYSEIKVTFDNSTKEDITVLQESYGTFYRRGRNMKMSDQDEIIRTIDETFKEHVAAGFDERAFNDSLSEKMFEKERTRAY